MTRMAKALVSCKSVLKIRPRVISNRRGRRRASWESSKGFVWDYSDFAGIGTNLDFVDEDRLYQWASTKTIVFVMATCLVAT
ncbi:hypothetical protein Dimus_037041 [Dionaea muscipula]